MKGDVKVIEYLNKVLRNELTAINQYFAHSKLCDKWGWKRLADKYREESIEEMHDAEKLIDRIIMLDGMPNLQRMGSVRIGETVEEQLVLDGQVEQAAIERYRRGVVLAQEEGAPATRDILESLVAGEEHHLDWIETQQSMIADMGIERYLLAQVGD